MINMEETRCEGWRSGRRCQRLPGRHRESRPLSGLPPSVLTCRPTDLLPEPVYTRPVAGFSSGCGVCTSGGGTVVRKDQGKLGSQTRWGMEWSWDVKRRHPPALIAEHLHSGNTSMSMCGRHSNEPPWLRRLFSYMPPHRSLPGPIQLRTALRSFGRSRVSTVVHALQGQVPLTNAVHMP
ncbi:hypothetical protein LZ30DRAFT_145277 [Colletotrichum cereale]|nr:hypothetical protein LZ30DRAFT_145277 [Colletotrichum cereale]